MRRRVLHLLARFAPLSAGSVTSAAPRSATAPTAPTCPLVSEMQLAYIDGDNWRLLTDFVYISPRIGPVFVCRDFVTDFNSTPRLLWPIMPPTEYGQAGLVHDKLYREGRVFRRVADAVHRDLLSALGAPWWKVWGMWIGLRVGGWVTWRAYRRQQRARSGAGR